MKLFKDEALFADEKKVRLKISKVLLSKSKLIFDSLVNLSIESISSLFPPWPRFTFFYSSIIIPTKLNNYVILVVNLRVHLKCIMSRSPNSLCPESPLIYILGLSLYYIYEGSLNSAIKYDLPTFNWKINTKFQWKFSTFRR